jgi:hypothetical protein
VASGHWKVISSKGFKLIAEKRRVMNALKSILMLAWLAVSLYVFFGLAAGVLIGSGMAGSTIAALVGFAAVGALFFGWWKLTTFVAVKWGIRK